MEFHEKGLNYAGFVGMAVIKHRRSSQLGTVQVGKLILELGLVI